MANLEINDILVSSTWISEANLASLKDGGANLWLAVCRDCEEEGGVELYLYFDTEATGILHVARIELPEESAIALRIALDVVRDYGWQFAREEEES